MIYNFNITLFTNRVYEYVDYPNLKNDEKRFIDNVMISILDGCSRQNQSKIIDFNTDEIVKYRDEYNFWLIDNILSLSFINIYGSHESIRFDLMRLYLFNKYKITEFSLFFSSGLKDLADYYTDLNLGVFHSGALFEMDGKDVIVVGQKYPYKKYKQAMLTQYFHIQVSLYSQEEIKEMISSKITSNQEKKQI